MHALTWEGEGVATTGTDGLVLHFLVSWAGLPFVCADSLLAVANNVARGRRSETTPCNHYRGSSATGCSACVESTCQHPSSASRSRAPTACCHHSETASIAYRAPTSGARASEGHERSQRARAFPFLLFSSPPTVCCRPDLVSCFLRV